MRVLNSIKNALATVLCQVVLLILNFITRIIVINLLGIEYLGINGLFSNILYLFSVAEMGINYALIYAMYSPMAESNETKLNILTIFYGKIYKKICIAIFFMGILMLPFLKYLVDDMNNIQDIYSIYILFLINAVIPYYFAEKRSIISVAQKEYILSSIDGICKIIQVVTQMVVLLVIKNYLLYLLVQVLATLLRSVIISKTADKLFPFLKEKPKELLEVKDKQRIFINAKALIIANITGIIFNGTDNIIIANVLGLASVGIYSNYMLITNQLAMFINAGINAITASAGNLNAVSDEDTVYIKYKQILFLNFAITTVCSIACACLMNEFIALTFGNDYLLTTETMLAIVLNFYLSSIRRPTLVFRNIKGLFRPDRHKGILECFINLALSIYLVHKLGLVGVVIGTVISTLVVSIWIEPFVLYKYGFKIKVIEYWKNIAMYLIFGILALGLFYRISAYFPCHTWQQLIIKAIFITAFCGILYLLSFFNREEFATIRAMLKNIKHR